jgi:hypothetical protein
MRNDLLHVVTAIANPIRWESRIKLFRAFEQHMLASGVNLTVVECALGERPFECDGTAGVNHVGVRARTVAWTKENLINIGISRLPATARYIAWIDADVEFRSPKWASDTVHALQQYDLVQLWSEALDLGPDGAPMMIKGMHVQTAFCKVFRHFGKILPEPYQYAHPGYAWAARRETLDQLGGLIETSGLGSADHQMAMAAIGQIENAIHGGTTPGYQAPIRRWTDIAGRVIHGNIGFV